MSKGLEHLAGKRVEKILKKAVSNKYIAVLTGTLITAIIHSSSTTSIILIGFVNAKMICFEQAMWVMLGANIGTTVTSQIMALNMQAWAFYLCGIGICIMAIFMHKKYFYVGQVMATIGVLFIAMDQMTYSMSFMQDSPLFLQLLTTLKNPFLSLLVGTVFTAILQSSTASVGVLQTLAKQGLVSLDHSLWIVYGQNIGTCITAFIASLRSCRNAKRVAMSHLLINILGMLFFIPICFYLPVLSWIQTLTPSNPASQIANLHTIFNIVSTLLLLPMDHMITKLTYFLIPERKHEYE